MLASVFICLVQGTSADSRRGLCQWTLTNDSSPLRFSQSDCVMCSSLIPSPDFSNRSGNETSVCLYRSTADIELTAGNQSAKVNNLNVLDQNVQVNISIEDNGDPAVDTILPGSG